MAPRTLATLADDWDRDAAAWDDNMQGDFAVAARGCARQLREAQRTEMTDTLGEDRLLDEVERAVKDGLSVDTREVSGALALQYHGWLARLCARVRHLEAEVEHEHSNATAILRKYEEAIADADRAEAASQRLTEALELLARSWIECACYSREIVPAAHLSDTVVFENCAAELRKLLVGVGAPPEDAR